MRLAIAGRPWCLPLRPSPGCGLEHAVEVSGLTARSRSLSSSPQGELGGGCPDDDEQHSRLDLVRVVDGQGLVGCVRKKSNQRPAPRAATSPATRSPAAAMRAR